jgi:hypothetical protein
VSVKPVRGWGNGAASQTQGEEAEGHWPPQEPCLGGRSGVWEYSFKFLKENEKKKS